MNSIVAHLLSNLTCSMRFEGTLNVDLNEITTNLVPYPDLKFLISSIAPLYSLSNSNMQPRRLDQMFKDIQHPDYQLINVNPIQHKYLSVGLIVRGNVSFSDVNRNINNLRKEMDMIRWNTEGFKYGICNKSIYTSLYRIYGH
ncbi:Tubulin/FtsZ, C-terminal [Pseudocohnilembus persalinus]|uniref:Tubulin/FtsZ, C-terminal n=1 Tax=Pseudocohnilembus persalinus TaxID=266149 RepID=A0A0V0QC47_PSEPJ|nr:Tubulin/FtsZ, C-terminal [Pseudocohnilembus persalinus]|eukprot:KRW99671.1 Tubulin/FtsZ, C-terminal [Pseudocohnilembus persalinus]